jgi:hypothetical protein
VRFSRRLSRSSWPRAPRDPRERFRLDVPRRTARARDVHEEITERVVELLDVGQHAHGRMVLKV